MLPIELMIHILVRLGPSDLSVCQRVSKNWKEIIQDESSWREAFLTKFGAGFGGRRLHLDSWRKEYTHRVGLLS